MNSYTYRKIFTEYYGSIPVDEDGRTYEIHHRDGNRSNNHPSNLEALTIKEHYKKHYEQGDFGACVLIAKRMSLPPDHISSIQKGIKRPGVGGRKKGCEGWNKGKGGYKLNLTEEGLKKKRETIRKKAKISFQVAEKMRTDFKNRIELDDDNIGKKMRNGKIMSYRQAFCKHYADKHGITTQYVYRILTGKSHVHIE